MSTTSSASAAVTLTRTRHFCVDEDPGKFCNKNERCALTTPLFALAALSLANNSLKYALR
jgi:hypothetical protein